MFLFNFIWQFVTFFFDYIYTHKYICLVIPMQVIVIMVKVILRDEKIISFPLSNSYHLYIFLVRLLESIIMVLIDFLKSCVIWGAKMSKNVFL